MTNAAWCPHFPILSLGPIPLRNPGAKWLPDERENGVGITDSPSAVVFRDKLYVFHQGLTGDTNLWYSVWDGANWAPDEQLNKVVLTNSPSAVVFNDQLYVFHQDQQTHGYLWFSVFEGPGGGLTTR
jgi:hypothetical protein